MATWNQFAAASPQLAEQIRALFHQYGPGLGYLATVRADGGPRVHPVSPVITDEGLYCFLIDSPKRRDIERDGRYALHAFPAEESDVEAYLTGHAVPVTDAATIARVVVRAGATTALSWRLFELRIDTAMLHSPLGPTSDGRARAGVAQVWRTAGYARPSPRRREWRRGHVPALAA
ncbi:pyridoxamine 5'-phosphate oxidase family protein [Hamadaea tsunoensis]|uniref:pyridoxamine 5'-phosphate oxidase family protein n=1 Tax=Hamadaea tsunoensis TaxID=53368 RepID=UPI0003F86F83|nr:pyridoxamine 5'-phosphate oxidase family protein [Hamadaea tsunoensis]